MAKKELNRSNMVTTSPSHTESKTRYQEPEHSRIALLTPVEVPRAEAEEERATAIEELPEVWAPLRKQALRVRIARRVVAFAASGFLYFDWLSEPAMTQRDRVNSNVAKARAELYAATLVKL